MKKDYIDNPGAGATVTNSENEIGKPFSEKKKKKAAKKR